jgi:hypothetical protein
MAWPGGLDGAPRLRRVRRIAAHVVGWPVLAKAGLLTGFAIAASVRHLLIVQPWLG